jgi:hypothetical protein
VTTDRSGHNVAIEQPQLVLETIREVVRAALPAQSLATKRNHRVEVEGAQGRHHRRDQCRHDQNDHH